MMIDSIKNGIVIDHITSGKGMEIYKTLNLEALESPVAILKNVYSKAIEKKDIIKIDADIDINLDVLGYIDPGATVNIIKDSKVVKKCHLALPERVVDVIKCKNPRCITSVEQELPNEFVLTDREKKIYRCVYCETQEAK